MSSRPRILFLTVGDYNWASSRYRSYWTSEIMEEADALQWKSGEPIPTNYDAYVWMKVGNATAMQQLRNAGKLQFVEVCDPNWWWQPREARLLIDNVDAVVAATDAARVDLLEWYGEKRAYIIPDRLKLSHYPLKRQHTTTQPVRLLWFGMAQNRVGLAGALGVMERLSANGVQIELTICDNQPDQLFAPNANFPIYHTFWGIDYENKIYSAHDIAVLPPYPGPWGALKSNNRMLTAWACGLAACDGHDYYQLHELCTNLEARKRAAEAGMAKLISEYRIEQTVEDWRRIVATEMELKR